MDQDKELMIKNALPKGTILNSGKIEYRIEDVLGEPIKIYTQITDFVEEDELERKAHFEATFYSKNEKRSVTIETENPESKNALILGAAGVALGTGALIGWNIYDKKLNRCKCYNIKVIKTRIYIYTSTTHPSLANVHSSLCWCARRSVFRYVPFYFIVIEKSKQ